MRELCHDVDDVDDVDDVAAELTDAPRYYSIGAVARRTGLSEHMLRVWERRYRVVAPERSRGQHRRYSEHDVRRLQLLRAAQRGGCSIGEPAR